MTVEIPDNFQSFDDEIRAALSLFAPPADLDERISKSLSRRQRLTISPLMVKTAAAAAAVALLATCGYFADQQLNPAPQTTALLRETAQQWGAISVRENSANFGWAADMGRSLRSLEDADETAMLPSANGKLREEHGERGREGQDAAQGGQQKAGANHDQDGQNVLYADGYVDWANTPWVGVQRDNIYARRDGAAMDDVEGTRIKGQSGAASVSGIVNFDYEYAGRAGVAGKELGKSDPAPGGAGGGGANLGVDKGEKDGFDRAALPIDAELKPRPAFKPGEVVLGDVGKKTSDELRGIDKQLDGREGELKENKKPLPQPLAAAPVSPAPPTDAPSTSTPATEQPAQPPVQQPVVTQRKVIRSGNMEFEVDSFDSAVMTVTKLVGEDGGFVASTDSAKLPNGKTRGQVTVRVPPDRLDTFVLKLRGLGDLKGQKITSQDVTKAYTDTESGLRAARAMEERLLDMIKKGQGSIKDLLAAEKELGTWREKIEQLEGEKRYYDNLIGLSTLTIMLQERDIKASSGSIETELINAGVETDDVEKARAALLKEVDDAKGRIISSDLKKLEAGQFAATITAEVPTDKAGPIVDRLKQLGKVARLDIDRKQSTVDGSGPPVAGAQVEKKPTVLSVSLYNLANVAPRLTTSLNLAATDVEAQYRAVMALVEDAGGRVVTSQLQRPKQGEVVASLQIEVPAAKAAGLQTQIQALGETMNLQLSDNPDTANVTTSKQGFVIRMVSAATVPPKLTTTITLASTDVETQHRTLIAAVEKAGGRMVKTDLQRPRPGEVIATLQLEVPAAQVADVQKEMQSMGETMNLQVSEYPDPASAIATKQGFVVRMLSASTVPPRLTTSLTLASGDVETQYRALITAVEKAGGRILRADTQRPRPGEVVATLQLELPTPVVSAVQEQMQGLGETMSLQVADSPEPANTISTKQGFAIRMVSSSLVAPRESVTLQLAARDVGEAHAALLNAASQAKARVLTSNVTQGDRDNQSATLQIELPRGALGDWQKALGQAGDILTRSAVRSSDTQNTLDSKLRIDLSVFAVNRLPPRQVTTATLAVESAEHAQASFIALAEQLGGRVIDQSVDRDPNGRGSARLTLDLPRDKSAEAIKELRDAGDVLAMNTSVNAQAPDGQLSRTQIKLTLTEGEALVGRDAGLWASIRDGLGTSLRGLGRSLELIIIGVCLIGPWALLAWGGWKLAKRYRARRAVVATPTT